MRACAFIRISDQLLEFDSQAAGADTGYAVALTCTRVQRVGFVDPPQYTSATAPSETYRPAVDPSPYTSSPYVPEALASRTLSPEQTREYSVPEYRPGFTYSNREVHTFPESISVSTYGERNIAGDYSSEAGHPGCFVSAHERRRAPESCLVEKTLCVLATLFMIASCSHACTESGKPLIASPYVLCGEQPAEDVPSPAAPRTVPPVDTSVSALFVHACMCVVCVCARLDSGVPFRDVSVKCLCVCLCLTLVAGGHGRNCVRARVCYTQAEAMALWSYSAKNGDELSFAEGDILRLHGLTDEANW